jgi:hypothetical protein
VYCSSNILPLNIDNERNQNRREKSAWKLRFIVNS